MRPEPRARSHHRDSVGRLLAAVLLAAACTGCPPEAVLEKGSLSVRFLGVHAQAESVWVTLGPYEGPIKEREVLGPEPLITSFELIDPGVYWLEGRSYSAPPVVQLQLVRRDAVEVSAGRRSTVLMALDESVDFDAGLSDTTLPMDAAQPDTAADEDI